MKAGASEGKSRTRIAKKYKSWKGCTQEELQAVQESYCKKLKTAIRCRNRTRLQSMVPDASLYDILHWWKRPS